MKKYRDNIQYGWVGNISFGVSIYGVDESIAKYEKEPHKWIEFRFGHRILVLKLW